MNGIETEMYSQILVKHRKCSSFDKAFPQKCINGRREEKNIKSFNKRKITRKFQCFKNPLSLPENQKRTGKSLSRYLTPKGIHNLNPLAYTNILYKCGFNLVQQIMYWSEIQFK